MNARPRGARRIDPLESHVQAAILDYLRIAQRAGVVVSYWRANAGHTRIPDPTRQSGYRVLRCNFVGCPDILGVLDGGRTLGIECKAGPRSVPTTRQAEILARWRRAGALVMVAWSVDQVAAVLGPMIDARIRDGDAARAHKRLAYRRAVRLRDRPAPHPDGCEGSPL